MTFIRHSPFENRKCPALGVLSIAELYPPAEGLSIEPASPLARVYPPPGIAPQGHHSPHLNPSLTVVKRPAVGRIHVAREPSLSPTCPNLDPLVREKILSRK